MNIFITGHKGYIGSFLYKNLKNKFRIYCFKNKKIAYAKLNNIDCIIHCAVKYFGKTKKEVSTTNYLYSKKIYDYFNKISKKNKSLMFINLNSIYAKSRFGMNRKNYYIQTKKKFSDYVNKNKNRNKITFVDLFLPTIYGEFGNKKNFYFQIKNNFINNKDVIILNPNQKRYFFHIKKLKKVLIDIINLKFQKKFNEFLVKPDLICTNYEFAVSLKKSLKSRSQIFKISN